MAAKLLKVYLDHHIKRENLLYRRVIKNPTRDGVLFQDSEANQRESIPSGFPYLLLKHLYGDESLTPYLRKPDFQRATWAWSPIECVDLLEAVLEERVVPSIILWKSPEKFLYVLDGGHRVSVLLAWIKDDWGDRRSVNYKDAGTEKEIVRAADEVRALLRERGIGSYDDYRIANRRFRDFEREGKSPDEFMDSTELKYAEKMRHLITAEVGFPILWVRGNYEVAEKSFLKINSTGKQLSNWETKLVENRTSSFARTVMAIAQISSPEHCWTFDDPEVKQNDILKNNVKEILQKVELLHKILFEPSYEKPIKDFRQPLMVIPYTQPDKKPLYIAELLTIVEGKKGQKPETEKLIKKDSKESVSKIIANGLSLVSNAIDVLGNIQGTNPRSITLVPLVYFYNNQGTHVRSLLYGVLFWLIHGTPQEVFDRKLLFTAHRKGFESVLLEYKDQIINRITRRIGSGAEVTLQTARYYNGLLNLLIKHRGDTETEEFKKEHQVLIETLGKEDKTAEEKVAGGRIFTGKNKEIINVKDFLKLLTQCEICDGYYYPGLFTQYDHIEPYGKGGLTIPDNARNTHPFCNNNRAKIEQLRENKLLINLPTFEQKKDKKDNDDPQLKLAFLDGEPETHDEDIFEFDADAEE